MAGSSNFSSNVVHTQAASQSIRGSVYHGPVHYHYAPTEHGDGIRDQHPELVDNPGSSSVRSDQQREQKLEEQRQARFLALAFDEQETRQATIEKALAQTCEWFLERPEYAQWLEMGKLRDPRRFLWIKGKPGCGKSTLMKFLVSRFEQVWDSNTLVLAFFFNARGSGLEKTSIGMYRSLLHQLLERVPHLRHVLDRLPSMTTAALQIVLDQAFCKLGQQSVTIFIDALDECHDEEVQDIVSFFDDVCSSTAADAIDFKICLSSRHYPYITSVHGTSLILEDQTQHTRDLMSYVQRYLVIGKGFEEQRLKDKLLAKAAGVFLWVKLVVKILNRRYRDGRLFELEQLLDSIPSDLSNLYRDILLRDSSDQGDSRNETALCLQWVLFAERPLSAVELYHAVLIGTMSLSSYRRYCANADIESIRRYILACSKGFLEETKSKPYTVQFIHETVRSFFLSGTDLVDLGPPNELVIRAHTSLAKCCSLYIDCIDFHDLDAPGLASLPDANSGHHDQAPLLEYAVRHSLQHSDKLQSYGISQIEFISRCDFRKLLHLDDMLLAIHSKPYDMADFSLLTVFASRNLPHLISAFLDGAQSIETSSARVLSPLHVAYIRGHERALRALLTPLPHTSSMPSLNNSLSPSTRFDLEETIACLLGRSDIPANDILCWAVEEQHVAVVRCLLNTGKIDVNQVSWRGLTALAIAASLGYEELCALLIRQHAIVNPDVNIVAPIYASCANGHLRVLHLLIESGCDLDLLSSCNGIVPGNKLSSRGDFTSDFLPIHDSGAALDADGKANSGFAYAALHAASRFGHVDVARVLLDAGADINKLSSQGETPLYLAARNGLEHIVAMLLEFDADLDATSDACGPAICVASKNGHVGVCHLLIGKGANVNMRATSSPTALLFASKFGHETIVKSLISAGANVNTQSGSWQTTALQEACIHGHADVAELLVNANADVNAHDKKDYSVLQSALDAGHYDLANMLLRHGARLQPQSISHTSWGLEEGVHMADLRERRISRIILKIVLDDNLDIFELLLLQEPLKSRNIHYDRLGDHLSLVSSQPQSQRTLSLCQILISDGLVLKGTDPTLTQMLKSAGSHRDQDDFRAILSFVINNIEESDLLSQLLVHFVLRGDPQLTEWIIDFGVSIDTTDQAGTPILNLAARNGDEHIAILLVRGGANVNTRSAINRKTALLEAATRGHWHLVTLLFLHGACISESDATQGYLSSPRNRQLLVKAALYADCKEALQQCVNAKVTLDVCSGLGNPIMITGVQRTSVDTVKLLLELDTDIDEQKEDTFPLLVAVQRGSLAMATLLLEHGAKVNQFSRLSRTTALYEAVRAGNREIITTLLSFGAKLNVAEAESLKVLHLAISSGDEWITTTLLEIIVDPVARQYALDTLLLRSSFRGHDSMIRPCITFGADPSAKDKSGNTALCLAAEFDHNTVLKILLDAGADINAKVSNGETALHVAARMERFHIVRKLLDAGADDRIRDSGGRRPVDIKTSHLMKDILVKQRQKDTSNPEFGDYAFIGSDDDDALSVI